MVKELEHLVIGAGIAGLSLAYQLRDQDLLIVERNAEPGGTWKSFEYKNSIFEFGPNSFISGYENFENLIDELNFRDQVISVGMKDSNRYLYKDSQLIKVPSNPFDFLKTKLLTSTGKLRILKELFISQKTEDESVFDFFERRFGIETAKLVSYALQGIWAGDTKQLSVSAAMPKLKAKEMKHSSILSSMREASSPSSLRGALATKQPRKISSFKNGMQSFCHRIAEELGDKLLLSSHCEVLERKQDHYRVKINGKEYQVKNIYIATKSHQAASLISSVSRSLAELLDSIYYAPVALMAFTLPQNLFRKKGLVNAFGYISADDSQINLGTIFSSEIFAERKLKDEFLFLNFSGGATKADILGYRDRKLRQTAIQEQIDVLSPWCKRHLRLEDFTVIKQGLLPKAIPQYDLEHLSKIDKINSELEQLPGIKLLGNYLSGISVAETIDNALAIEPLDQKVDSLSL